MPRAATFLRSARPGLLALALVAAGCTGSGADSAAPPGTEAPPPPEALMDPAVLDQHLAWLSASVTGPILVRRGLRADARPDNIALGEPGRQAEALAWSPTGSDLAYAADVSGDFEIWVVPAEGDTPVNVTNDPGADGGPVWSPDGSRIAFFSNRTGAFELWVMGADGSDPQQLSDTGKSVSWITWTPDGSTILYAVQDQLRTVLYAVPSAGGPSVAVSDEFGAQFAPTVSPDGATVAFAAQIGDDDVSHVYLAGIDGRDRRRLTDGTEPEKNPGFSPDGSRLLYLRTVEGEDGGLVDVVIVRDLTSGEEWEVSANAAQTARQARWSPDGKFVAFTTNQVQDDDVVVVNADGSAGMVVSANPSAADTWPAWDPIGPSRTSSAPPGSTP